MFDVWHGLNVDMIAEMFQVFCVDVTLLSDMAQMGFFLTFCGLVIAVGSTFVIPTLLTVMFRFAFIIS